MASPPPPHQTISPGPRQSNGNQCRVQGAQHWHCSASALQSGDNQSIALRTTRRRRPPLTSAGAAVSEPGPGGHWPGHYSQYHGQTEYQETEPGPGVPMLQMDVTTWHAVMESLLRHVRPGKLNLEAYNMLSLQCCASKVVSGVGKINRKV